MLLGVNLFDHLFNFPFFIDNKGCADHAGDFLPVHDLLAVSSVSRQNLLLRISYQREWQIVLFSKSLVRFLTVRTDAQYYKSLFE